MRIVLDTNVSGDRHLLAVPGWAGIHVLRPKTFVDEFLQTVADP